MIGNIKKFCLNNFMSTDFPTFDLICDCTFDSDNGEIDTHLSRDAVSSETFRGEYHITPTLKYSDVFNFQITLLRGDFTEFNDDEQRKILSWLTQKSVPSMIDFYDDIYSNTISFSILGYVSEIKTYKVTNSRTVGYVVTFESVFPWALSPIQHLTKTVTSPLTFDINCETDNYESLIYPKLTITQGSSIVVQADHAMTDRAEHLDGTVYKYQNTYYWVDGDEVHQSQTSAPSGWNTTSVFIDNQTTNVQTKIAQNVPNEIITIDGANKVIYSSSLDRIIGDGFNWKWLGLKYGKNTIKVVGNCEVVFEWRFPIKIGEI